MTAIARDCCFRGEGGAVPFEAARRAALGLLRPHGRTEQVALSDAAGRVVAGAINAPRALPPFDQAAMDGYAVRLADKAGLPLVLPVIGRTDAGDAPAELTQGAAHRIMTGAALPRGADTVAMQEDVSRKGDLVQFGSGVAPGAHIRHAGEDVRQDEVVLDRGCVIGWPEIALLAALGIGKVTVAAAAKVAVVTTGSELAQAGSAASPGCIYDANGPMLSALLGGTDVEVALRMVADDAAAVADALAALSQSFDIVVTTAGMAAGDRDHVREAVRSAGGALDVVKVAMKPGKPLALGRLGAAAFAGLPGNPQAAAFGALAFVRPMISLLLGEAAARPMTASVAFSCGGRSDRTELLPVRLSSGQGRLSAHRCGPEGSHRLMPMALGDAVAIIPPAASPLQPGDVVEILPFHRGRR